ncbi:TWiK family of potassium channels protein 7 [Aphelenchoides besseyi]|nr:TWiK family of potassium channels protein 7 [Aphelenchoides besseyi]
MGRRHRRSKVTRVVNLVKRIIAFFFSHVGLCALVIGYALLGAVVFRAVEGPHEEYIQKEVSSARSRAVNVAWNATFRVNKLDRIQWEKTVYAQVKAFQKKCMWAIRRGYDGKEHGISAQWTFTGSFLYSKSFLILNSLFFFTDHNNWVWKYGGENLFWQNTYDPFRHHRNPADAFVFDEYRRRDGKNLSIPLCPIYTIEIQTYFMAQKKTSSQNSPRELTSSEIGTIFIKSTVNFGVRDDCSLESLGFAPTNTSDIHELLAARAHLDQLEVKESVEAQLQRISVPLSLVLLTMLAYLVAGAILFCLWEQWSFLDSFYFCYISLTTIGFGDKFPGASVGNDKEAQEKLVITSVYLLFGMALLAMCFNLAQEEVVNKVAWLANKFRSKEDDEYD